MCVCKYVHIERYFDMYVLLRWPYPIYVRILDSHCELSVLCVGVCIEVECMCAVSRSNRRVGTV